MKCEIDHTHARTILFVSGTECLVKERAGVHTGPWAEAGDSGGQTKTSWVPECISAGVLPEWVPCLPQDTASALGLQT